MRIGIIYTNVTLEPCLCGNTTIVLTYTTVDHGYSDGRFMCNSCEIGVGNASGYGDLRNNSDSLEKKWNETMIKYKNK